MLNSDDQKDEDNVFGTTYQRAKDGISFIEYSILQREGQGFESEEECVAFAKAHNLDNAVFIKSTGDFRIATHKGAILQQRRWQQQYQNILFWHEENKDAKPVRRYFMPTSYHHLNNAKIAAEQSDGIYQPLYCRNYFVPTGSYDPCNGTFNSAKPSPYFARETGADTSHIHLLLQKISGECYPHVLAWLRAKMVHPTVKTEVVPIFIGGQGTGKSTFGEVICKALFGEDNVLVTDQYDASARFNTDSADKLIICLEEKEMGDKRNTSATLKSRATAVTIRKESKGLDATNQESHADLVMTTNEVVPLKFEDRGDQRRFMVMEGDYSFTRMLDPQADEVFTQLYGLDSNRIRVSKGMLKDPAVIEQFKHDLWTQKNAKDVNYKKFPKTDAYQRCYALPRTNEATAIEAIIKSLVPFIKESLIKQEVVKKIIIKEDGEGDTKVYLDHIVKDTHALMYLKRGEKKDCLAVCKQSVFVDDSYTPARPFAHSVTERTLLDMRIYFRDHGLMLLEDTEAPKSGFRGMAGKERYSSTAWFTLLTKPAPPHVVEKRITPLDTQEKLSLSRRNEVLYNESGRLGQRVRYNSIFRYAKDGEFETLNELKPGCFDRKSENAQYLDTFLLEADETTPVILQQELIFLHDVSTNQPKKLTVQAEQLFASRLEVQEAEADRLMRERLVCRVVYSGNKSLHMLVRVQDSPENLEERNWLDAYLKATLSNKLVFDTSTKDPTRLTRAPVIKLRRIDLPSYDGVDHRYTINKELKIEGTQRLLAQNWDNVYQGNWRLLYRHWKDAPAKYYEQRRKMLPAKQQYKDAAIALLEGTFFSNPIWNGSRQENFFPAYRLLRHMGYSAQELWDEFESCMKEYPKRNEVNYWLTRRTCALIRTIDQDIDENEVL